MLLLLVSAPRPASGHPLDDSYIALTVEGSQVSVRWDLSLRDLDAMIDLDTDRDGRITDEEVSRRREEIAAFALPRLRITDDGKACLGAGPVEHGIAAHGAGRYAVLRYRLDCGQPPSRLVATYDLFFDVHPDHRGLITVAGGRTVWSAVLSEGERTIAVAFGESGSTGFASFFGTGATHLLEGIDHLLFLAVVLLPILLAKRRPGLRGLRRPLLAAVKILTAFTLAHGLTLWLAVLGIVAVPSRLVESAIALSIAATAIDNVRPFLGRRRWLVALGFGLVHGLGFASTLGPLALPPFELAMALLAFNLGLEAAQFGVALLALPAVYLLGRLAVIRRMALPLGSAIAGLLALLWFAERAFEVTIFS